MLHKCVNSFLRVLFLTEWRIPHLYPVLHQLPTVRWHRVCLWLCLFTTSVYCTKPTFSLSLLSHLDLTSTYCLPSISHGSFVYQSMHYLFSLPWQTDMLYRNHLSRSQIVYWLLCLGVSLPPFLPFSCSISFSSILLFTTYWQSYSLHTERWGIMVVPLSYWTLLMFYSALCECAPMGHLCGSLG